MIRILFFVALGGTITLSILAAAGADIFFPWSMGFLTATVVLLGIWIPASLIVHTARRRRDAEQAEASGRLRSALILSRRQTGLFINEQPEVQFDLLVDRPRSEGLPFRATAKRIVSLLDVHEIARGKTLAVAHPEPE